MYDTLEALRRKNSFVSVYTDTSEPDSFWFGKIDALDEYFVLLRLYTTTGKPNGLYLLPVEQVIRVSFGGQYEERMRTLIGNVEEMRTGLAAPLLDNMLAYCIRGGKAAEIELNDSGNFDVSGIIESVSDSTVTVQELDIYGRNDGKTVFRIDDISCISYDRGPVTADVKLYRDRE